MIQPWNCRFIINITQENIWKFIPYTPAKPSETSHPSQHRQFRSRSPADFFGKFATHVALWFWTRGQRWWDTYFEKNNRSTNHSKKGLSRDHNDPAENFAPPKKRMVNFPTKRNCPKEFLGTWSFPPAQSRQWKAPGWVLEVFVFFGGKQRKYVVLEGQTTGKMFLKLKIVFLLASFFSI